MLFLQHSEWTQVDKRLFFFFNKMRISKIIYGTWKKRKINFSHMNGKNFTRLFKQFSLLVNVLVRKNSKASSPSRDFSSPIDCYGFPMQAALCLQLWALEFFHSFGFPFCCSSPSSHFFFAVVLEKSALFNGVAQDSRSLSLSLPKFDDVPPGKGPNTCSLPTLR